MTRKKNYYYKSNTPKTEDTILENVEVSEELNIEKPEVNFKEELKEPEYKYGIVNVKNLAVRIEPNFNCNPADGYRLGDRVRFIEIENSNWVKVEKGYIHKKYLDIENLK